MTSSEFMIAQSTKAYFENWALNNGFKILDASSPDRPSIYEYARAQNAEVVADPRGKAGYVLVVRRLHD